MSTAPDPASPLLLIRKAAGKRLPLVLGIIVVSYVLLETIRGQSNGFGFSTLLQFTLVGLGSGAAYAIAASGLVLTYTTTGTFNFAHGAVGMISAFFFSSLRDDINYPFINGTQNWRVSEAIGSAKVVLGVLITLFVVAPIIGLIFERVLRTFKDSDVGTRLTVTIAFTILLFGIAQQLYQDDPPQLPHLFGNGSVSGVEMDRLVAIPVALLIALVLRWLLYSTRTGVAMRAVVDNPDLAGLNGTKPTLIARYSWMLGSVLAALGGIMFASAIGGTLETVTLTFFVLYAYGAAIVGRLKSLPLTFFGAALLGLLDNWLGLVLANPKNLLGTTLSLPPVPEGWPRLYDIPWQSIRVGIPGLFLLGALLFQPEVKLAVGRVVRSDEPKVPSLLGSLGGAIGLLAVSIPVVLFIPSAFLPDLTTGFVYSIIMLSLVLLTGYSGQVSLAQIVFVGIGAWFMGQSLWGNSLFKVFLAGLVVVPLGALVALPALRLQGLYLALATLAFALAGREILFQNNAFFGFAIVEVGRPDLFGIQFEGNRAFAILCVSVFAIAAIAVLAVRRSPYGRRLSAMRDSPAACATLGLDLRATKLIVFCGSAALAGIGGALTGSLGGSAATLQFEPITNLVLFLFAIVGGITTTSGAFTGGMLFAVLPYIQAEYSEFSGLAFSVVAITAVLLGKQPNGLVGLVGNAFRRMTHGRSLFGMLVLPGPMISAAHSPLPQPIAVQPATPYLPNPTSNGYHSNPEPEPIMVQAEHNHAERRTPLRAGGVGNASG